MVKLSGLWKFGCPTEVSACCRMLFVLFSSTFMHNTTQGISVRGPDPAAGQVYVQ